MSRALLARHTLPQYCSVGFADLTCEVLRQVTQAGRLGRGDLAERTGDTGRSIVAGCVSALCFN